MKTGMNEVKGMRKAIETAMNPLLNLVRDKAYWDSNLELSEDDLQEFFVERSVR